jgi:hypothetical protein
VTVQMGLVHCQASRDVITTVTTKNDLYTFPVTILVVTLDQAALQGLLRKLYSLGLPLISVVWVESFQ